MTAPLEQGVSLPGWYRGWPGTVHYFTELVEHGCLHEPDCGHGHFSGVTICSRGQPICAAAPWAAEWGPPKAEKKRPCWPCEKGLERRLAATAAT